MSILVRVGNLVIGGGSPIVVQSMTKTDTRDVKSTIEQIFRLQDAGCELVRCAVPDMEAAIALKGICEKSPMPVCADIHFDYRLAVASLESGCHKLRLNPGNLQDKEKVKLVAREAKARGVPIRVGVNSGSIKHTDNVSKEAVEIALKEVEYLDDIGFHDIVVSVKTSDIDTCIQSNRLLAQKCPYPIHIGLTEAGSLIPGLIRSSAALLPLLRENIGDTIRVSLTDDPEKEVEAAWELLELAGKRSFGPHIISCPTCGRTRENLRDALTRVRKALGGVSGVKVAVMGCEVNGPGEAKDAECGIAFGTGRCAVFEGGVHKGTFSVEDGIACLVDIARRISDRKNIRSGSQAL